MGTSGPNPTSVKGSRAPPWTWGWQQCPKVIHNVHYQPHQWVEDQTARKHCDITESFFNVGETFRTAIHLSKWNETENTADFWGEVWKFRDAAGACWLHSDADKCIKKSEAECPLVWPMWSEVIFVWRSETFENWWLPCLITSTLAASFLGFYYSVANLRCLTSSCEVHSADCSIL